MNTFPDPPTQRRCLVEVLGSRLTERTYVVMSREFTAMLEAMFRAHDTVVEWRELTIPRFPNEFDDFEEAEALLRQLAALVDMPYDRNGIITPILAKAVACLQERL